MTPAHEKLLDLWRARQTPRHERLVAFVVMKPGHELDAHSLHAWLSERLPDWMIPSQFVATTKTPRTVSGKLNREALPPLTYQTPDLSERILPPRTPVEMRLAELFGDVLGHRPISVYEDFFMDLGGHSLAATQLASAIRREWPIDFPLRIVFERPTVDRLAEYLEQAQPVKGGLTKIRQRRARD